MSLDPFLDAGGNALSAEKRAEVRRDAVKAAFRAIEKLAAVGRAHDDDSGFTPNAHAVVERLQADADDLLHEALANGWITKQEADAMVFAARWKSGG